MAGLPSKSEQFMDWYLEVVEAANLSDKRYPVKGMNVWTPYGFLARRGLDRVLSEEIEASGSSPVEFPALIPQTEFQKEKEHIQGFDAQVYWVTRGGTTELDVPLLLRPTSETAMYPIFALWVRSHRDLPLQVYQIVNTFRYETKTTRPFLRVREIHFFEEHTCQVDEAAATARVESNLAAFSRMAGRMLLPYLALRRPEWDKFAGAFYSIAFDVPVGDGRTLQIGSVHHYRENFSRAYGIQYEDPKGETRHAHQTTFGLSERLLGAIVAVHGDERGVVFPSSVAPYPVVVVPVLSAKAQDPTPFAREVVETLTRGGIRAYLDDSDERPGAKYYRWELRGVPLRLEVGGREAAAKVVTSIDRLGERGTIPMAELGLGVRNALASFDERLRTRAQVQFSKSFVVAVRLADLASTRVVPFVSWCGAEACGHQIEQAIDGGLLGTFEGPSPIPLPAAQPCIACGKAEPTVWAVAGRPL